MSQVQILATRSPVSFDTELVSCSPNVSTTLSVSFNDKPTNTLVDRILSSQTTPSILDTASTSDGREGCTAVPGLPLLYHGHPDTHLRNGVMRAAELAADGEPDAEKAFFVADLSYVYHQHLRWKRMLPEIEPFYGRCLLFSGKAAQSHDLDQL